MNNPNKSTPAPTVIPHPLHACVSLMREHVRKIDNEGLIGFDDYMSAKHGNMSAENLDAAGLMSDLMDTLRARFQCDVEDMRDAGAPLSSIPNYEDRLSAFDMIDRAGYFGAVAFTETFLSLAPYILSNIHPEDVA